MESFQKPLTDSHIISIAQIAVARIRKLRSAPVKPADSLPDKKRDSAHRVPSPFLHYFVSCRRDQRSLVCSARSGNSSSS